MYNYIDERVVIDFPLPGGMLKMMAECEEYDKQDDYANYEPLANNIAWVGGKLLYSNGKITKKQWEKLQRRYLM